MGALATYSTEASLAGAANKVMLAIHNPASSGKVVRVCCWSIYVPSSSGTEVVVHWEARRATAFSGGSALTATRRDTADPVSDVTLLSGASAITPTDDDPALVESRVVQINSFTAPATYQFPFAPHPDMKPVVLHAGEGLYLKQIENNTSTHKVGIAWTEETP